MLPTLPVSTAGGGGPGGGALPVRSPPGSRIEQYEIIRPLGRGGMGEVHLARDLRLGRLVAIKLLTTQRPDLDERVLAEARATARCRHDNIVVIYEVGAHRRQPYMVLEYLEGQTLRQWMNDHAATAEPPARVPPTRAVELMLPVVRALAYAHDQGIVHRDLKPENVMLTRAGVIKVLDFGVAKHMETPAPGAAGEDGGPTASSSTAAGTRPYMAPEQLNLGDIDHRADVWAVGIMLFELVAGAHPVLDATAPQPAQAAIADESAAMPSASERVPGLGPLAAIIDRCLLNSPAHRTPSAHMLLAELEALAPGRGPASVSHDGSPFAGLAAFQETDADRFFGRDRDIDQVVAELRSRPLVAVVGPSGAGKSSLVRAGVIPALKRSGEGWDVHIVRPGRAPLAALAAVLVQADGSAGGGGSSATTADAGDRAALEQLRSEPGMLGARLRAHATARRRRIAVFVDQLEELYTLGAPPAERSAFLGCVAAVADDATSPLRVLATMRSDFLDRLAEDRRLGAEITRGLVLLSPMDEAGMREALVRPVEASEHRFDPPALVDRMVDALAATRGALPLLQFTAARLWERRDRDGRRLTEASYEQLGGVAGALAMHADAVLATMSAAQQPLVRAVLERLVTPERTRALVSATELRALRRDPALVDDIVQHLAAMRLVVIERGTEDPDASVELVHESLIDRWPTLVRWLDDNQDDAAMLARLRVAARDWERGDHAPGLLWTGAVAREAGAWQQRYGGELPLVEQRYLAAVLTASDRARRVRRRLFAGILTAAVIVAVAMAWLAWTQTQARRNATEEATRARDATRMAAMRALPGDPTTQLALLREIEEVRTPPPEATEEAKRLLHGGVALRVLPVHGDVLSAAFSPDGRRIAFAVSQQGVSIWNTDGSGELLRLRGHDATVWTAAFSPDGRRIASASGDGTVRIWNADGSGDPLVLRHGFQVLSVAWSPDGRRVVSGASDKMVRIWSADGRGEPLVLRGHTSLVSSVAWSPDGRRIVSAARDKTVRVWNADGSGEPVVLRGHDEMPRSVAFSPDGQRVLSAAYDKTLRVWNADGSGEALVLRHDGTVSSAAFSPDGQRIVSGAYDKLVRIWSADGRGEPLVLRGHEDAVVGVAWSSDGRRVVSASQEGTARVWNMEVSSEPVILRGHDSYVTWATFSPDGQRIASASQDGTVRVWSADGRGESLVLRGHSIAVESVAFSPDGRRIVSASSDQTIRVWSADGRGEPLVLRGHEGGVYSAVFSPDGRRIVSSSSDNTVRVWNAEGRAEPLILRPKSEHYLGTVGISPDGRRIVFGVDKTVQVWNAEGRGEPLVLRGHDANVVTGAFSPDGRRIVSASTDRTVRVWNADGSGEPLVLRGHEAGLNFSAAFSPDGRRIVSAGDTTVRIWHADGTGATVILVGHDLPVLQAAFSPDGQRVVSVSKDLTVRLWHDLAPVTVDDPRLWAATSYCMPIERRIKLLGVTEDQAGRDRQRCLERVEHARAP